MTTYDLIILGSGPAGLTAGIYAARYNLKTLVIGTIPGGMAATAHKVCNYPGFTEINGFELTQKILKQTKDLGVEVKQEIIKSVTNENDFVVETNKEKYSAKKIIIALGTEHKKLGIEDEGTFLGKGLSYCATCDAGFFKDKTVGVVGGGNSALTSALLIASYATKVYLIYRKDNFFRAEQAWVDEINKNEKIEVLFETQVTKLIGNEKLEKIEINNEKELEIDGLFVTIGSIPKLEVINNLNLELEEGHIKVDSNKKTNIDGIYAVGDVTNTPLKQIISACSDGAIAAYSIYKEIQKGGKR